MPARNRCLDRISGFTLVEMLLTITLFAMVMSTLVVGLRTGVTSWRSVRAHQSVLVDRDWALDRIARDLRALAIVDKQTSAVQETAASADDESLAVTRLGERLRQRDGSGPVWYRVTYALRRDDSDAAGQLVRTEVPCIARSPYGDAPRETVLLTGVTGLRFEYLTSKGATQATWEQPKHLPVAIIVTLTTGASKAYQRVVSIPCGSLAS